KLIEHLEQGYSRGNFPECDWDTVERYVAKYPNEFPPQRIAQAIRTGRLFWESMGRSGAAGKIDNFSATAWIFNMKNRSNGADAGDKSGRWRDSIEVTGEMKTEITMISGSMTPAQAAEIYHQTIKGL